MANSVPESPTTPTQSGTSDAEFDSLNEQLLQRRRDLGYDRDEIEAAERKRLKAIEEAASRLHLDPPRRPQAEIDAQREMYERRRAANEKQQKWDAIIKAAGKRYDPCSLQNFVLSNDGAVAGKQQAALDILAKLVAHMDEHVEAGGNVILYGPPGTGKDHLLFGLLRSAISRNFSAQWINGQDLYGAFRDNIDSDTTEERLIRRYCEIPILAISDPVPPKGDVSNFSASMLYRIVDGRYRRRLGSWFTVNVANAAEGEQQISGPVFDRMRDNAVTVFCNWPSYRQTNKPEWLK